MNRTLLKSLLIALGCTTLGFAGGALATKKVKKDFVIVPAGEGKFAAMNPADPDHSPQVAWLQGNPKTGPVAFLLKTRGTAPLHWHSSDYWAMSVEGTTKHFLQGQEGAAKENPPGTFWYQPGGDASTAHNDVCVTESGCTLFIFMDKGNDFVPVASK